jgi:glutamate-1-semialdehyde 2,1-aminomutase
MKFKKSEALKGRAHLLIPGGCHTYAKGDDQYPEHSPGFLVRGEGSHVWDVDGNEFIEYGMGLRAVSLGHGYKSVVDAASKQMGMGINFTRPMPIEVECAEELLSVIPSGEMVKFAKNGSDVTSAAIRLSRAYTGRDRIAICGDHPFFSVDDWFIGSTPMNAGIPAAVRELTVKFQYNNLHSLEALFDQYPDQIACVIMEGEKESEPVPGFLQGVQELCRTKGALFVLDEAITGFRWHLGGAQGFYGLTPDLSTFGKALGNGFSVAALVGKREIMRLGGLDHDMQRVFLLSYTHGAESHSLAAAREVIRIYKTEPVIETLWERGRALQSGIQKAIEEEKLTQYFQVLGKPCCLIYSTLDDERRPSQSFRTLFLQETIKRGIIAPSFVISYSHSETDVRRTVEAVHDALVVYRKALQEGISKYLEGRPVKPVFRCFN